MDFHVREFYHQFSDHDSPSGNFHKVIELSSAPDIPWETIKQKVPGLIKGWYELAHLSTQDRIDFTRDFWLSSLSYHPRLQSFIERFFASLDDVTVFITQRQYDDDFEAQMIYSVANDGGFFRGNLPATETEITEFERKFSGYIFPSDYLAFMQIHNGFCKATDTTGIFRVEHMEEQYQKLQTMIESINIPIVTDQGMTINAKTLIPFYESFGMPFFQCFWGDWYPQNVTGMGNVYFSPATKTISNPFTYEDSSSMSFATFLDWLMFYLERVTS